MRRTANVSILADDIENDLTNINNLLSINKKIQLLIGFTNTFNKYLEYPILWFPQGIYVIISPNISHGSDGTTISLTLHDKMALLNGECGGTLPASISFHEIEKEDRYGNITIDHPTIKQILIELLNHWGGQQLGKIIINDLDEEIPQVLRWNGDTPLYVYKNIYSENKGKILEEILRTAYNNIEMDNKPSYSVFLQELNKTYPSQAEISNLKNIIYNLETALKNSNTILSNIEKRKEYLNSCKEEYEKRYRYTPNQLRDAINQMSNFIIKFRKFNIDDPLVQIKNKYATSIAKFDWVNLKRRECYQYQTSTLMNVGTLENACNRTYLNQILAQSKNLKTILTRVKNKIGKTIKYKLFKTDANYRETKLTGDMALAFVFGDEQINGKYQIIDSNPSRNVVTKDRKVYFTSYKNKNELHYHLFQSYRNLPAINLAVFECDSSDDAERTRLINYTFFREFRNLLAKINENKMPNIKTALSSWRSGGGDLATYISAYSSQTNDQAILVIEHMIEICDIITQQTEIILEAYNEVAEEYKNLYKNIFSKSFEYNNEYYTFDEGVKEIVDKWKIIINNLPRDYTIKHYKDQYYTEAVTVSLKQYGQSICFSTDQSNFYHLEKSIQQFKEDIMNIDTYNLKVKTSSINSFSYLSFGDYISQRTGILYRLFAEEDDKDEYYYLLTQADKRIRNNNPDFINYHKELKDKIENINKQLEECDKSYNQIPLMCYIAMHQWCKKDLPNYEKKISQSYLDTQKKIQEDHLKDLALSTQNYYTKICNDTENIMKNLKHIPITASLSTISSNIAASARAPYIAESQAITEQLLKKRKEELTSYSYVEKIKDFNENNKVLTSTIDDLIKDYNTEKLTLIAISDIQQQLNNRKSMLNDLIQDLTKTISELIEKSLINEKVFSAIFLKLCYEKSSNYKQVYRGKTFDQLSSAVRNNFKKSLSPDYNNKIWLKFYNKLKQGINQIITYQSGADIGYTLTTFTYPGELVASPGDTVASVLDKIQKTLGNFEYYYDINGNFIFQQIRNYLNTSYASFVLKDNNKSSPDYSADYVNGKTVYNFSDGDIIQSYTNTPRYEQIKNDFIVWGERTTTTGLKLPIRYHLALDTRPAVESIYFFDVPASVSLSLYNNKNDFPLTGQANTVYYAAETNLFYEWVNQKSYAEYLVKQDLISTQSLQYTNKNNFPKIGQPNKLYYDQSSGLLYKCTVGISNEYDTYKITNTYRILKCSQNSKNFEGKYEYDPKYKRIFRYTKNNQGFTKNMTNFTPIFANDFRTELYLQGIMGEIQGISTNDYYAQLKNEWPKLFHLYLGKYYDNVLDNQSGIDYFLDILSDTHMAADYGISNIGKRTHIISNNAINCIFEPNCPTYVILDKNPEEALNKADFDFIEEDYLLAKEQLLQQKKQIKQWCQQRLKEGKEDQTDWIQIEHSSYEKIVIGGILRSAYEEIRGELYQYITYNEQVSLTTLPIYYLEPNVRIAIKDSLSGINGDFIIHSLSIPLDVNGTMSISCSKAIERI